MQLPLFCQLYWLCVQWETLNSSAKTVSIFSLLRAKSTLDIKILKRKKSASERVFILVLV